MSPKKVPISCQKPLNQNVKIRNSLKCFLNALIISVLRDAPSVFIVSFSHHIMLALTMDRYIFIEHPLHYPLIITLSRTWLIVLLAFLGAVANCAICAMAFQVTLE